MTAEYGLQMEPSGSDTPGEIFDGFEGLEQKFGSRMFTREEGIKALQDYIPAFESDARSLFNDLVRRNHVFKLR